MEGTTAVAYCPQNLRIIIIIKYMFSLMLLWALGYNVNKINKYVLTFMC